ncbi:AAA family ATPase [Rhodococcus sp. IEGM 1366]|uniref:AAA family ATPase n=1 Tax=Rhodococcus sp. IEGM 1366 TaxID=3082223 RepID=UPI0029559E63|nr:AAA family ATPase [Rhodococcus sp. IEGM 1366]MDV8069251.1 AAA family ATPase [Rhodococcus sp. IEGM 1366]
MFEQARARKQFDAGMIALGYAQVRGAVVDPRAARAAFQNAVEIDPDMCDGWLGLAATGLVDSHVIANLFRTANTSLFQEQRRVGAPPGSLKARFSVGTYVTHVLSNGTEIWAGAATDHITAKRYDSALAILNSVPTPTELTNYVRAVLFTTTDRWPQVLQTLSRSEQWSDNFLRAGANLMAGRACAHLGLFDEAQRKLGLVEHGPIPVATQHARHLRGLIARELGDEATARSLFERVYVASPGDAGNNLALQKNDYRLTRVTAEQIDARTDPWDPSSAPSASTKRNTDRQQRGEAALAASKRDLDAMIGLTSVKREVDKLTAAAVLARSSGESESSATAKSRHLVFTGPPGVGKTEVARILARMYFGLGILETDKVVEVAPGDFFAPGYGTPEERSRDIFERALDGVLFIDEAYSLYHDGIIGGDANGTKVINALLATMENHRDRLVVIVAGYEAEMDAFLERNAGLRSRFAKQIRFPSYTPDELVLIAEKMARTKYRATLSQGATTEFGRAAVHLCSATETAPDGTTRSLIDREGNGRFMRNLIEGAIEERDLRIVSSTSDISAIPAAARALIERDDVALTIAERHPYIPVEIA